MVLTTTTDRAVVTIANGASLSDAVVPPRGSRLVGIVMPSGWTAAALTFQGSADGTTFKNVHDAAGAEKTVTAAADRFIALDPKDWLGVDALKVRSGTSGTAVNQGAARVIVLVFQT